MFNSIFSNTYGHTFFTIPYPSRGFLLLIVDFCFCVSLRVRLVFVGIATMEGLHEVADVGQCVVEFGENSVFIILMGMVVAGRDVGATDTDTAQGQSKDIAALARGN